MDCSGGIYQIIINQKGYIGSTVNLKRRKIEHLSTLKSNSHFNIKLQRAYNKYRHVEFKILYYCKDDCLEFIEDQLLKCNEISSAYNIKPAARGGFLSGSKHAKAKYTDKQIVEIIRLINLGLSNKEISNVVLIKSSTIDNIRNRRNWKDHLHLLQEYSNTQLLFIERCKEGFSKQACKKYSKLRDGTATKLFNQFNPKKESYIMPYRKFNIDQANIMRELYSSGMRVTDIANKFDSTTATVCAVVKNRIYRR